MNDIRKPISVNSVCKCCENHQNQNRTVNPDSVARQFLSEYYRKVSNIGWNVVTDLFERNCVVIVKNKNVGNSYDMLNALSSEYIKRANYDNIRSKWVLISRDKMLLSVFGNIQFVLFNGSVSKIMQFNETFVLTGYPDGSVKCTHHLMDF
jgi:hypothetical protein